MGDKRYQTMATQPDPIRVLHVDDEPDFGEIVAEFLERAADRVSVETAQSPAEVIAGGAPDRVDCIVSDYDMPRTDGLEFLEAVREDHSELPFILFTGKGGEGVASDAISAGVTDYLEKGTGTEQFEILANRIENAVSQYRAKREATELDRRLQELTDTANDILWIFTADWDELLFVNSAYEEIWGRSRADLAESSRDFLEGVHPADRDHVRDAMAELSGGESIDVEYRVNPTEDYGRWVWVQGEPVFDEAGEVVRVAGFARDVTDRKHREQRLERYEALVENTEDGIYVFEEDGVFEFVNQRVAEVSGIPQDAWVGEHVSVLVDLETLTEAEVERIEAGIEAIVSGEETEVRIEVTPEVPHDLTHLELRLTPLPTETDPTRVIGFSRDVTERREHEDELTRKNERLENFTSFVSHDLRNPLRVAEGNLELGREACDTPEFERVSRALHRMDTLIEDMLSVAQHVDQVGEFEPVALATCCRESWANVETGEAALALETDRELLADGGRLKQLLENLVRNAVEHGGEDVTVTVGDLEDGEGFFVADDGPGIPAEHRDRVFEDGYTTTDAGTGLGLTIVDEIARAHDWTLSLTEGGAGGARFEFRGVDDRAE